jgi:acetyltransferase-like isoleucine patch superfamily enzyme
MYPGISSDAERRLLGLLDPAVTDLVADSLIDCGFAIFSGDDAEARALGITVQGDLTIVVTDPDRPLGDVRIQCGGKNTMLFVDNRNWGGNMYASIRVLGSESVLFFNDIGDAYVSLPDIYLRSNSQILFWGRGASAVGCSMEIDGTGASVVIGDDALISGGVWIRNHDMHAIHDLTTGAQIGRPAVDTVLERHVWLGQDAMLLQVERIGMGAIIGARSLLKGRVPPRVAMAGIPARLIRQDVSWGRDLEGMTVAERASIGLPPL